MPTLSRPDAQVDRIAAQHGFSADAAQTMLDALVAGNGSMAQFEHPEFGGSGQWMRGGMVMAGAFDDHALKARIDRLCTSLADVISREPDDRMPTGSFQRQSQSDGRSTVVQDSRDFERAAWWPRELGRPDSAGMQDDVRYAWFAGPRRLAIESDGRLAVYDTGDHRIGGFSQQQGSQSSVSFASQHGPLDLDRLPVVSSMEERDEEAAAAAMQPSRASEPQGDPRGDPFAALEKLAQLHQRGVIDAREFETKKAELLARI